MSDAATDVQLSAVMRSLAAQRWGASKPVSLARELALRAHELPEIERRQLLDALTENVGREASSA